MATQIPVLSLESFAETLQGEIKQATAAVAATPTATGVDFLTTQYVTIDGFTNDHATVPAKTIDIVIPTCIQTIKPDANGYLPPGTCNALWDYYPSFSAALAFTVIFGLLTIAHLYEAIAYRKVIEVLWAGFRSVLKLRARDFAGNGHIVLARMIYFFAPSRKVFDIPAPALAAAFVTFDFVAFMVQLAGGSMAGPTAPAEEQLRAIHVYMGGIGLQQLFIVVFVAFAVKFQLEMHSVDASKEPCVNWWSAWRLLVYTLYASLTCITVRIIFRLVEFSSGSTGVSNPLVTNETYFYILEAMPMLLAILAFNIIHPGSVLVGPEAEMPGFVTTCISALRRRNKFKNLEESDNEEMIILRA
ncbi:RTA1 like protein-domain-containing protein [Hypoxylon sp. FL0890]|nr:RTA1 like protein-domain-containing protein [Hypoxylon sp. FL0890]